MITWPYLQKKVSLWKECIFWKNDQHYPTRETFDICILLSPQKRKVHVGARPAVRNAPGACADLHDAVTPAGIWVTTLTPVGLSLLNVSRPVHLLLYFRSCQTPWAFVILILGCSEDVIPRNDWRRRSKFLSVQVIEVRASSLWLYCRTC